MLTQESSFTPNSGTTTKIEIPEQEDKISAERKSANSAIRLTSSFEFNIPSPLSSLLMKPFQRNTETKDKTEFISKFFRFKETEQRSLVIMSNLKKVDVPSQSSKANEEYRPKSRSYN